MTQPTHPKKFLGRYLDVRDMTWKYSDGSGGAIPEECRLGVESVKAEREVFGVKGMWLKAFGIIQGYKNRLNIK